MPVESVSHSSSLSPSTQGSTATRPQPATSALDTLVSTARTGSAVDAGNALRTLDAMNGRNATNAALQPVNDNPVAQPAVWRSDQPVAQVLQVQDTRTAGRINLLDHEGRGIPPSHTLALHVGKSRDFLMNMMQPLTNSFFSAYRSKHSTFNSLESANALVSSTLATGQEVEPGVFYKEFSSPTGTAAVRRDMVPFVRPQGRVSFETAYGVLVVTRPDAGMPGGFRIQTAYPTIPFSGRGQ